MRNFGIVLVVLWADVKFRRLKCPPKQFIITGWWNSGVSSPKKWIFSQIIIRAGVPPNWLWENHNKFSYWCKPRISSVNLTFEDSYWRETPLLHITLKRDWLISLSVNFLVTSLLVFCELFRRSHRFCHNFSKLPHNVETQTATVYTTLWLDKRPRSFAWCRHRRRNGTGFWQPYAVRQLQDNPQARLRPGITLSSVNASIWTWVKAIGALLGVKRLYLEE